MTIDDLKQVSKYISDKYQYNELPISDKVIALSAEDKVARVIIAISAKPDTLDIAFSPITTPSEVAAVMSTMKDLIDNVNVTQDFYIGRDKEMYLGLEAMTMFAADLHKLIEDAKFQAECDKDGDPLLKKDVFIVTTPLEVATPEKVKEYYKKSKHQRFLEKYTKRGRN